MRRERIALHLAAGVAVLVGLPLSARLFYLAWSSWRRGIDLRVYEAGAAIGLERGWAHVYDLVLQRPRIAPLFPAGVPWTPFASPPPVAWITLPFIGAPSAAAIAAWSVLLAIALAMAGAVVGGRRAWGWGLLSMAALPATGSEVALGNIAGLLPLSLAGTALLLLAGRDAAAGVVLAPIAFKPQLAWLAPLALLVAGRWRAVMAFAIAASMLALLSLALLGPHGVNAYLGILHNLSGLADQRRFSLDRQIDEPALAWIARALICVAALIAGYRSRRHRPGLALAAGVAGSMAVTPYLNIPDLVLCVPVAWWLAHAGPSHRWRWAAGAYWLASLLALFWELPWLIAQLGLILALAVGLPGSVAEHDDHFAGRDRPLREARHRI